MYLRRGSGVVSAFSRRNARRRGGSRHQRRRSTGPAGVEIQFARRRRRPWLVIVPIVVAVFGYYVTQDGVAIAADHPRLPPRIATLPAWNHSATLLTGVRAVSQPSGWGPPSASAIRGYRLAYVTEFNGHTLPQGWMAFAGSPGSDPGSRWAPSHVAVTNGLLRIETFRDSRFGNEWVSGGVCQCGRPRTYGAYFVRSRATGPGPTQVELLWPTAGWPPEIDFDESYGATTMSMATTHFGRTNAQIQNTVSVDLTQWHTWGVIWTPTSITYTVDGRVWGHVTTPAAVPDQFMTLNIQQQTWCSSGWACPKAPQSLLVDWVAEYAPTTSG